MTTIILCTFIIMYVGSSGRPARYQQACATCEECGDLVRAYLEAGPPHWLDGQTVAPACMRREQEAMPA